MLCALAAATRPRATDTSCSSALTLPNVSPRARAEAADMAATSVAQACQASMRAWKNQSSHDVDAADLVANIAAVNCKLVSFQLPTHVPRLGRSVRVDHRHDNAAHVARLRAHDVGERSPICATKPARRQPQKKPTRQEGFKANWQLGCDYGTTPVSRGQKAPKP